MTRKFLIIDDEPDQRLIYRTALEGLINGNVEVMEADNIKDAFELIRTNEFAAIVLDNQLPGDTGFRLLYELHQKRPHPHIIFMSAAMTNELTKNATALGAAACLEKSDFNPVDVVKMIEDMINDNSK